MFPLKISIGFWAESYTKPKVQQRCVGYPQLLTETMEGSSAAMEGSPQSCNPLESMGKAMVCELMVPNHYLEG